MAENKDDKKWWEKALRLLDLTNNVEKVGNLYGATEEARNDSRLDTVITGNDRPASHKATEAGAWITVNGLLPLAGAAISKFGKGAKGADKAAKALSKVDDVADSVEKAEKLKKVANATNKEVKNMSKEAVKEIGKEVKSNLDDLKLEKSIKAGKEVEPSKMAKGKVYKDAKKELNEVKKGEKVLAAKDPIVKSATKSDKENVVDTLDKVYSEYEKKYKVRNNKGKIRKPADVEKLIKSDPDYNKEVQAIVDNYFTDLAKKTGNVKAIEKATTTAILPNFISMQLKKDNGGDYAKDLLPKAYDPSIEIGKGGEILNNILNFFDLDGDDPDKYPMDKVDALLKAVNGDGRYWNPKQIEGLSDSEKVNLIKMISNHKFDDDKHLASDTGKTPYTELRKAYKDLLGENN